MTFFNKKKNTEIFSINKTDNLKKNEIHPSKTDQKLPQKSSKKAKKTENANFSIKTNEKAKGNSLIK
jgi:hypothetical protein